MVDAKVNRPIWDYTVRGLSMPSIYIYIYIFVYIYIASVSKFMPFTIFICTSPTTIGGARVLPLGEGAPPNAQSYLRTPLQENILYTDIR